MRSDEPKTVVVFRAPKQRELLGDPVTAVFPELSWSSPDDMACYSHIGQHSGCTREWYATTRPARPSEYRALAKELRGRGYRLDIKRRVTQGMDAHRRADYYRGVTARGNNRP